MEAFLKKHWLALIVIAVLLYLVYTLVQAIGKAVNTAEQTIGSAVNTAEQTALAPFQWLINLVNSVSSFFGGAPNAGSTSNGTALNPTGTVPATIQPAGYPNLGDFTNTDLND